MVSIICAFNFVCKRKAHGVRCAKQTVCFPYKMKFEEDVSNFNMPKNKQRFYNIRVSASFKFKPGITYPMDWFSWFYFFQGQGYNLLKLCRTLPGLSNDEQGFLCGPVHTCCIALGVFEVSGRFRFV